MYGASILYAFDGGAEGEWVVERMTTLSGEALAAIDRLRVHGAPVPDPGTPAPVWRLRGVASHLRYTLRSEAERLAASSDPLGRPEALCAALIPISKSARWWSLAQDERRQIYEERSRHTSIGMEYLPAIARRLHHGRDLGEPFDFLTWFEYAPADEPAFEELLRRLRGSEEWDYVEREIDIRLRWDGG